MSRYCCATLLFWGLAVVSVHGVSIVRFEGVPIEGYECYFYASTLANKLGDPPDPSDLPLSRCRLTAAFTSSVPYYEVSVVRAPGPWNGNGPEPSYSDKRFGWNGNFCPPGSYGVDTLGYYGSSFFVVERFFCISCPPGSYSSTTFKFIGDSQQEGLGTVKAIFVQFGDDARVRQRSTCERCPTGFTSAAGSTDLSACKYRDSLLEVSLVSSDPAASIYPPMNNPPMCDFYDETYTYPDGLRKSTCLAQAAVCAPGTPIFFCAPIEVPVYQLVQDGISTCPSGYIGVRARFTTIPNPGGTERDYCVACTSGSYRGGTPATFFASQTVVSTEVSFFKTCTNCPGEDVRTQPATGATGPDQCFPFDSGIAAAAANEFDPQKLARISAGKGASGGAVHAACAWAATLGAVAAVAALARW